MAQYRGTNQADEFVGGDEDDQFEELGSGNDSIDGGDQWDFVSYRWDGGSLGIKATLGPDGNGTVIDTFGDTDTIISVQGFEGSRNDDQFVILAGGDYNIQPDKGSDTIQIDADARVTLDYAYMLNEDILEFVRELNLDITGIEVDVATGTITAYNGDVDTFTNVHDLRIRGTRLDDVMRAADDGLRTIMDGRGGSDTLIAGDYRDIASFEREAEDLGVGFTIDLAAGRATNTANSDVDTLVNFTRIRSSNFDDTIIGSGNDEFLEVLRGNDSVNGGGGVDTVAVWAMRDGFTVTGIGTDTVVVNGQDAGWGEKTLQNVERIEFDNGMLAVDINGNAGQAYRLYQAAFDRTPDQGGLNYWLDELDEGKTDLVSIARSFILSDEFRETYGEPDEVSNEQFLELLYANVLDREPDAEGLAYWTAELNGGQDRAAVLVLFSESDENRANVMPAIKDGIWFEYD